MAVRIVRLKIENIGGLQDCEITLPDHEVLALAGANGTGKSKMLACLLSPWTGNIPNPGDPDKKRSVSVTVQFDESEIAALEEYSRQSGWNETGLPNEVLYEISAQPITGNVEPRTHPRFNAVTYCFRQSNFLKAHPTFNLIYLPAERRFVSNSNAAVDLAQLAEEVALQKTTEARSTAFSGRLDDGEFETYAKALCVSGSLPSENPGSENREISRWQSFKNAVDLLLYPKSLKPLTRENPDQLRIELPEGGFHAVGELSSGERQALVIISRVFRAGEGHSIIAIDEPDAYLHPALSTKLLSALQIGLREGGRLLVATHSPSILDSLPPQAIYRLSHDNPPTIVESEGERIDLYREAGFKASSLTQASLLVATEGDFDEGILPQLVPILGGSSIRGRGGRAQVLKALESLVEYDVPIIGVVDADVMAPPPASSISSRCFMWPAADIEGVLLSDKNFLLAAIKGSLVKSVYRSITTLNDLLARLLVESKDQAIAEIAQRILRSENSFKWPTPRGNDPIARLRSAADPAPRLAEADIDAAITRAEEEWQNSLPNPWKVVRGKWILGPFVSEATDFKRGAAFLEAVAATSPRVSALEDFGKFAKEVLEGKR
ncbi:ATP-binding protein [Streptomyces sp. LBUM 1478]|uniref:AAA family ATPase n=1 Tax=Streptomyces scabiei TaxID=1930 RepID=UPI000B23FDF9|nr:ATP-binding protein [Streptomyces scabiei]MBP5908303.1 ATP-binding protein [Streptomyces sp. LBUM 1478]MBP5928678.1 ATP-binding protein [Streptomyces sp. LBUM 1479]